MMRLTLCFLFTTGAAAHGVMYEPQNRATFGMSGINFGPGCTGGSCLWFNQGCSIGCEECKGTVPGGTGPGGDLGPCAVVGTACCNNPAEPTITFKDKTLRTYGINRGVLGDWTKTHPWRKPGSAPVADPCGLACGWYTHGTVGNGGNAPPGFPCGSKGSELKPLQQKTVWIAGSTVEVAWGVYANHGGGYQYRLCPATSKITEECFSKTPLEFVGDTSWIQYGDGLDVNNRTEIPAVRTSEGTLPAGSTWTRNPIPACNTPFGGGAMDEPCLGPIFNAPVPGAWGFGGGACASGLTSSSCNPAKFNEKTFHWGIVDTVLVPTLPDGDYVISFRWDSEQTPQVWNTCGDVTIKAEGTPTKPFQYYEGCEACHTTGPCSNCTKCLNDKTGDCAYCWNQLKGYDIGLWPKIFCLGYEDTSGGQRKWKPGDAMLPGWSPGCPKCWNVPPAPPSPPPPSPPAPISKYTCDGGVCVAAAGGVDKSVCLAACVPPEAAGGLPIV